MFVFSWLKVGVGSVQDILQDVDSCSYSNSVNLTFNGMLLKLKKIGPFLYRASFDLGGIIFKPELRV